MRIMKRIVSACLALGIASMGVPMTPDSMGILPLQPLSASAAEAASGTCGENLTWVLDNGTLTISGEGEMTDWNASSAVPWDSISKNIIDVVIEDGITSIGTFSFHGCSNLTAIIIPDSVTSIGNYAFAHCSALTTITIPDSVTSIGDSAFYSCDALTTITIPNGVTSIGDGAFFSCDALTTITIPDSVTSIGESTFSHCDALTGITIPDSVTSIGSSAFNGCEALTTITIPDSVTSIGGSAFDNTPWLSARQKENPLVVVNGILIDGTKCEGAVAIPDSVTSIGACAFYECSGLTTITIPDSVTSIGSLAFDYCSSLTSITIPDSVTSIGSSAFHFCDALTTITVSEDNASYTDIDGVLFTKDEATILTYPAGKTEGSYVIPDSVTSIGNSAFWYCDALTDITIPDSVTSIGSSAFRYCHALTSITIPDSVTSIGSSAFNRCDALTTITIPDSVTSIGKDAFFWCDALTTITIQNPECEIYNDEDTIPSTATIHGYAGSTAQAYAKEHGLEFVVLEETPEPPATTTPEETTTTTPTTTTTTESTTTTTESTTTTTTTTESTTTTTTTESTTTTTTLSSFKWSKDNWSFTETTSTKTNGELIGEEYLAKLKEDLTNVEYESLFGKDGYFSKPASDRSYGMSAVMLLAKYGMLPFGEYKDGAENLYALENNEEVQSLITYYDALRYKDNYMQNLVDTNNRKNKDNVQKIKELMGKYGMILLSYTTNSGAPHTVLVYTMATKGGYTSGGKNYDIKLSVCDPTKSDVDYIYFTEQGGCSVDKVSVCFIDGDPGLLNDGGCLAGSQTAAEGNYIFIECEKLNNQNNDIELDGEKKTMNNVPCFFAPNANPDGEIFQTGEGELDVMIRYSDWLLRASTKDHATVRFNKNDRVVSVTANEAAPFTLRMTLCDNCPMTWFTLHVSGASAKKAALTAVENGYILESDENLSGITAEAFGRDSAADISFSCEYKKVLIYQTEENTLGVKADADDDGVFETEVPAARKLLGDVNEDGSIDSVDAAEILVAAAAKGAGGEGLSEAQAAIADVDSSGDYDATDAAFILQYAAYAGSGGTVSLPDFIGSLN